MVVAFQPVASKASKSSAKAHAVIDRFKRGNPDVAIPFLLVETRPAGMFSVPAHIRYEYTDAVGDRLGAAMARIVASHQLPASR